jgi:hypothetical protein
VLEIKVFPIPTPIYGGVNGMVIDRNFKALNLLLTTNDDVSIGNNLKTNKK